MIFRRFQEGKQEVIYITGDCHAEYRKFNKCTFPKQLEMTKDDYIIVCGDFGIWKEDKEQGFWMDWLNEKPFTTLFVDGNHENFDLLNQMEEKEWHGGKVHFIRDSVIHLMRGQVFNINGYKIFSFGGARSHDISDGILDPSATNFKKKVKLYNDLEKEYRINHVSWWKEEMPNDGEFEEGIKNLSLNDWKVDFIITHCCSSSTQTLLVGKTQEVTELNRYFEDIKSRCDYKKWYFGHYHQDIAVNDKEILTYRRISQIA